MVHVVTPQVIIVLCYFPHHDNITYRDPRDKGSGRGRGRDEGWEAQLLLGNVANVHMGYS